MKVKNTKGQPGGSEPVGIVISGMPLQPSTTVFSAYVWSAPAGEEGEPKAP